MDQGDRETNWGSHTRGDGTGMVWCYWKTASRFVHRPHNGATNSIDVFDTNTKVYFETLIRLL